MEEEPSKLPFPDAFVAFLEANGIDPSIYASSLHSTPRYIRYPLLLPIYFFFPILFQSIDSHFILFSGKSLKPNCEASIEEFEAEMNCKLQRVDWLPGFYSLPSNVHIATSKAYLEGKVLFLKINIRAFWLYYFRK